MANTWNHRGRAYQYLSRKHPLSPRRKGGDQIAVSRFVLYEKIGAGPHPCHWCGKLVDWIPDGGRRSTLALLADHLDGDKANDTPDNLVPACYSCNTNRDRPKVKRPDCPCGALYFARGFCKPCYMQRYYRHGKRLE